MAHLGRVEHGPPDSATGPSTRHEANGEVLARMVPRQPGSARLEHGGSVDGALLHEGQRFVGLFQGEASRVRADRDLCGLIQKSDAVFARVGGHAAQHALAEELAVVVDRGDRGHVDSGAGERAAGSQGSQGGRHELAGGRKED